MHKICLLSDIIEGQAKQFSFPDQPDKHFLIVRRGTKVWAYLNMCPHMGVELQWQNDKFMSLDGCQIQCSMHGALFNIHNGRCTWGPCLHRQLSPVEIVCEDNHIYLKSEN